MDKVEEFLNERWAILHMSCATPADRAYYEGALKAIEMMGYTWERYSDGTHKVYK